MRSIKTLVAAFAVAMLLSTGAFAGADLNEVGAFIWDCLESDCSREDIVDAIVAAYDVDRIEASTDADELVGQLIDRGLVEG